MSVVVEVGRAASWNWNAISAVATAAAAIVALFVGVTPMAMERIGRRRQARVLAQILVDKLSIQEVHIRTAMRIPKDGAEELTPWEFKEICELLEVLDSQPVANFVAFTPSLPRVITDAVAQCEASLFYAQMRRPRLPQMDVHKVYTFVDEVRVFGLIADQILKLRQVLHAWIKSEPQDFSAEIENYVQDGRSRALREKLEWESSRSVHPRPASERQ
ncbi:hypothetical protein [Stenotrophomonas maltophilia]|uniref:hypothetical protein n=1 Tax=Stenotrophomonas maltophilia TaxID=40324 RepID=UPI001F53D3A7|nr:hypothetical protein [Stenotrophomonas maltophilia]MCI1123276.1 hypothetical protein [Stenotrophomonas maltophilia]